MHGSPLKLPSSITSLSHYNYIYMGTFNLLILHVTALAHNNTITDATPQASPESNDKPLRPGVAIIVGILTTIFFLAILLLMYIRHCERGATYSDNLPPSRVNSGIERRVVESLPLFKFSSLTGHKEGLECAVCLNRFDPDEVLRLLPKCKHAFHVECVDTWLDAHSTCPLCRYRVDPEDLLLVADHNCCDDGEETEIASSRKSSWRGEIENSNSLEIIVEDPGKLFQGSRRDLIRAKSLDARRLSSSSRSSSLRRKSNEPIGTSRRSMLSRRDEADRHRLEHRIIISSEDDETPRRWSDVHDKEMLYLRSGLILGGGNDSGRKVINKRSVSETTVMSRFRRSKSSSNNNNNYGSNVGSNCGDRDENGVMKRWLSWISQSKQEHEQPKEPRTRVQSSATDASASSDVV